MSELEPGRAQLPEMPLLLPGRIKAAINPFDEVSQVFSRFHLLNFKVGHRERENSRVREGECRMKSCIWVSCSVLQPRLKTELSPN